MANLLDGFRALDLTGASGLICGQILANHGVDVIKIEQPGGDQARYMPPFAGNSRDPEKSLFWMSFNVNKRSITLNLETEEGRSLFRKLAKTSHFILESFAPGYLDNLGIGYTELRRINPGIIVTSITPFGQKGPYSRYKSCNLIAAAMSGVLDNNGDPDRPPVTEAHNSAYFESGAAAALGTVMAHYHRQITGEGQHIDISLQECMAARNMDNVFAWQIEKRLIQRYGNIGQSLGTPAIRWIWPCRDGDIFGRFRPPDYEFLSNWFNEAGINNPFIDVSDWATFNPRSLSRQHRDEIESAIIQLLSKYTKKELVERLRKEDREVESVNTPAEIMELDQHAARKYWAKIRNPGLNMDVIYPGHYFICSGTENRVTRPAPGTGEHNEEIYMKELKLSPGRIKELQKLHVI
jgi:crotonobetainyl-CoA:carnitine CoA-transferase CaiB-like acyl-CoA transferase